MTARIIAGTFVLGLAALAGGSNSWADKGKPNISVAPAGLLAYAATHPTDLFHVIVQGSKGNSSKQIANDVANQTGNSNGSAGIGNYGTHSGDLKNVFSSINGVAVTLSGKDLLKLARHPHVRSITPDEPTQSLGYQNSEMWRLSADVAPLWDTPAVSCATDALGLQLDPTCVPSAAVPAPQAPAIAIVDSGIDSSRAADFGGRVVASVNVSSLTPGASGDGEGHGTMVAGVAAGASPAYPGVAQNAPLVDVRTSDANGMSLTSDVIAGCDWILAHKDQYGIRVANLSQAAVAFTNFYNDPLDQAVERLWLNGVVVVTAAGNYGTGTGPVDTSHAPGNDPFVITVGALDQNGTADPSDDFVAPWSAYGYTADGFMKPELSAPGRYMIMPVPDGASIAAIAPDRIMAPGYMWMSGTSFAAPIVSGAAAQLLARHPDWTPDQVKGALMLTANALPAANGFAGGVGEVDAAKAAAVTSPPNPNAGLDQFVTTDPATSSPVFDVASWSSAAATSASWNSASWNEASWNSASWNEASWNSASWNSASWNEASWNEASWNEASWNEASWNEASWNEASWNEASWNEASLQP